MKKEDILDLKEQITNALFYFSVGAGIAMYLLVLAIR